MNPVSYFEIPVADLDRAIRFYESVFSYKLERTTVNGNQMALFPFQEGSSGTTGALAMGESYRPSKSGTRVYFAVLSIDVALNNVGRSGGRVTYPKTSIGELGWVAEFEDSEGNIIAIHSTNQ